MIIVDAPPVLPVPDALTIGRWTDGAVLAVRYDTSRFPLVERANRRLAPRGGAGHRRGRQRRPLGGVVVRRLRLRLRLRLRQLRRRRAVDGVPSPSVAAAVAVVDDGRRLIGPAATARSSAAARSAGCRARRGRPMMDRGCPGRRPPGRATDGHGVRTARGRARPGYDAQGGHVATLQAKTSARDPAAASRRRPLGRRWSLVTAALGLVVRPELRLPGRPVGARPELLLRLLRHPDRRW